MKLAVVDNLPDGGAKRVVFEQIKHLKAKHTVVYFTNQERSSFPFETYTQVYRYKFKPREGIFRLRFLNDLARLWLTYRSSKEIAQKIDELGLDGVLAHPCQVTQSPFILVLTHKPTLYYAQEWLRVTYEPEWHQVIGVRGLKKLYLLSHRQLIAWLDRWLIKKATLVMTNSKYTQNHLKLAYGVKARVNYPGVDTRLFSPPKYQLPKYYLYIGEKDDFHGFPLLDEIDHLSGSKIKLKIVTFKQGTFSLTDKEMVETYRQAIALLSLDWNEPFGLSPLEAMACGVPVVAINEGGYVETVVDGVTGFLVSRDSKLIYQKLLTLAHDQTRQQAMGKAGRGRVVKHFNWQTHTQKVLLALEEIIDD